MARPTREEVEAARTYFERLLCLGVFTTEDKERLGILLADTEPATEEVLEAEARDLFGPAPAAPAQGGDREAWVLFRARVYGYVMGAHREGRR